MRAPVRGVGLLVGLVASLAALAGCGGDEPDANGGPSGDIIVFAASSLTDAFTALGEAFTSEHPGTEVEFNFAASSALVAQVNEGAPADVFASADEAQMSVAVDSGNAADPVAFASNALVVVVPVGEGPIMTFEDLARSGYSLVLAGPDVPVGRYAREALTEASERQSGLGVDFSERVLENLVSEEANVRAVLAKVQLGEADAGIVYRTDAAIAGDDVRVVEIPGEYNVAGRYPIAVVTTTDEADTAQAFIDFVLSEEGQAVLAEFGFGPP